MFAFVSSAAVAPPRKSPADFEALDEGVTVRFAVGSRESGEAPGTGRGAFRKPMHCGDCVDHSPR